MKAAIDKSKLGANFYLFMLDSPAAKRDKRWSCAQKELNEK